MDDAGSDNVEVRIAESRALVELKEHQKQIQLWLFDVKKKIYEIETSYLEGKLTLTIIYPNRLVRHC